MAARHEIISLAGFIAEVANAATLEARGWESALTISDVDPELGIEVDRDLLFSAVVNLLQNGFKFSHAHTGVALSAYASGDRILIDVEDHCGGLPPACVANMFEPFAQNGADRTGLGLGLTICQRSVEANHGALRVRDLPGKGCVFTIDLPRHLLRDPAKAESPEPANAA